MSASLWSVRLSSRQQLDNQKNADLMALVASGQLGPDDMVWREGLDDWVKASELKGLFPPTNTNATSSTDHGSAMPTGQPAHITDKDRSRKRMVQIGIGILIFLAAFAPVHGITQLHFVLGAAAGLIVTGFATAAAYIALFKPDILTDRMTPTPHIARTVLIAVGLAGVFGFIAAIQVPSIEREEAARVEAEASRREEERQEREALITSSMASLHTLTDQAEAAFAAGDHQNALAFLREADTLAADLPSSKETEAVHKLRVQITAQLEHELRIGAQQSLTAAIDRAQLLQLRNTTPEEMVEVLSALQKAIEADHVEENDTLQTARDLHNKIDQRYSAIRQAQLRRQIAVNRYRAMGRRELIWHIDDEIMPREYQSVVAVWNVAEDFYRDENYYALRWWLSDHLVNNPQASEDCRAAFSVLLEKLSHR